MTTVLAIDAGTTGVTALVVDDKGAVVAQGYREFAQHFPEPGWVEHDPDEIWSAVLHACRAALASAPEPPVAVGVTDQRETAVLWDRETLAAPRNAIVWQDRRSASICDRLRPHEARVSELTGLRLDPYFTGTKLTWLAENDPAAWAGVVAGRVAVGTVDSYVLARLTGGAVHATEPSNASRTLLYDITRGAWSEELCDLLGVPLGCLPEVRPTSGPFGRTDPAAFLGLDLPVTGMAGDQQAALFGQACFAPGESKCTYGTGSFVLVNTGSSLVRSTAGLLTTVAWDLGDGPVYALEGAVFVTGAAVQWLRDGLGVIATAAESEALARSVPDTGDVYFVPALTGLGAPDWDAGARGAIVGITRGTTAAHLARATLEAIAFQVRDVVDTLDPAVTELSVDGGASANDLLCQLQADQLGVPVRRPRVVQTTALGAAFLAGLGAGVWSSTDELRDTWRLDRRFEPAPGARDDGRHARWRAAVDRARGWAAAAKTSSRPLDGETGRTSR
jgi:glycerol kinase